MTVSDSQRPHRKIYLSPPDVRGRERELLLDALESNWIAPLGPHVDAFEREMCTYIGATSAAALSSGTAALHLALLLVGVEPGDTVLASSLTFVATANAIRYVGATPVFVDSDEATWNMCPTRLGEALEKCANAGKPARAIVCVDLYGQCADYAAIQELADQYRIPIIEDAAEALGASFRGCKAGRLGSLGVFSFNGNKIITTSGGGMLVSDKVEWIERARHLATQARLPVAHYEHEEIGYNYRLSNLLAAVGRAQLETLDERIERRHQVRAQYRESLASSPGLAFMPEPSYGRSNAWLTCLLVDEKQFGASRDQIIAALGEQQIEARPVWKPMHLQPAFRDCTCIGGNVSEQLFTNGMCLPSGSDLTAAEVARVVEIVKSQGNAQ